MKYEVIKPEGGVPVKMWTKGVPVEDEAKKQLLRTAQLPFIYRWMAAMPDVHVGKGATIGSVIPTDGAIIPAAVGVDIGCGMAAVQTTLRAEDLPDNLHAIRTAIEKAVPHGKTFKRDRGSWHRISTPMGQAWAELEAEFKVICAKYPGLEKANHVHHLGTLGTGNHFIEVCLDEVGFVWVMLHSGSRGIGNQIGTLFIEKAKEEMRTHFINLPDQDLSYLSEGTSSFDDYVQAVGWAQKFAKANRKLMMEAVLRALAEQIPKPFQTTSIAVNCHHNYVQKEMHYGKEVWLTRKGAVSAREGELGIIPGSMGAKSYIVRGKGNPESFCSCSHGAGRAMSRAKAFKTFTIEDQIKATEGVECRKDGGVLDEIPMAYKDIDLVMKAQTELVDIVHTLKQVICVKG